MKRFATALIAAALAAGCASDPKAEAAKDREKSKEEIRKVAEEVIAAMKENRPDAYHERLCRAQREAYPLEDMRKDWNDNQAELRQKAASMAVKTVAVDDADPNIASVLLSAPALPEGSAMYEAIREEGVWRIRELRKK